MAEREASSAAASGSGGDDDGRGDGCDEGPPGTRRRQVLRPSRWRAGLRLAAWAGLVALCAVLLRDAVCGEPAPACQEAAQRGTESAERACRAQYFRDRDPDDGLALARVLLGRRELRGAAAIAQGLLLTPARPDALLLLARVALLEGRQEEAQRSLELAAEQHLRVARWREGVNELLELGELMASRGQESAARGAFQRALEVASEHGDQALVERSVLALVSVRAAMGVEPAQPASSGAPAVPSLSGSDVALPLGPR